MAQFTYEAMNSVGQSVKGELGAVSSEEAIAKIRAMGNFPTKIKEKAAKHAKAAGRATAATTGGVKRRNIGAVGNKQLTTFTRQFSTLQNANLPIVRSLRILEQQQKPGTMRLAIRYVAEDVEGGSMLSEGMAHYPKAFDRLYTNMVRAGELGGVLDGILRRLAEFMEKSQALKRKVISAMIYPIAVLSFAGVIVTGLMVFVVPKFQAIFADMGSGLPAATQLLLDMSFWLRTKGWMLLIGVPVGVVLISRFLKASQTGRYFMDSMKLKLPIIGMIFAKTAIARFTRTLGTLVAAGVPILEALTITADTAGNEVYAQAITKVRDGIREGENLADPLRKTKIVDPMVVNMIDVGEETGELDQMLTKIADTYDEEVEALVGALASLMEPVMVIVLGVIVGFIVIALFMPMVKMITVMQT